jgi:hypothetical protein
MGKLKAVILLIIILAIAIAVYSFTQKQGIVPVVQQKTDFLPLFTSAGITVEDFNETISSFNAELTPGVRVSLKQGLVKLEPKNDAEREFSVLLGKLLSFEEKKSVVAKQAEALIDTTLADFCKATDSWESKQQVAFGVVEEAIDLNLEIENFYDKEPAFKGYGISVDMNNLAKEQENSVYLVNRMIDICIVNAYSFEEGTDAEEGIAG